MKDRGGETGPSRSILQLWLASRSTNSSRVVKLVDELSAEVGVNTRVPHLEGERIFGSAKQKLDLLPNDESDSHRHDHVNYSILKLEKGLSPAKSRGVVELMSSTQAKSSINSRTPKSIARAIVVCTMKDLLVVGTPCSNSMAWRIERISSTTIDLCRGYTTNGTRYNAKIAKYQRAIAASTFIGIQRLAKSTQTEQMQFWFCPGKLQSCVMGVYCRSIVHFPTLRLVWLVKSGTNLTKEEVDRFEASRFVLNDGSSYVDLVQTSIPHFEETQSKAQLGTGLVEPTLGPLSSEGDKQPKLQNGKLFLFAIVPFPDHISKMESSKSIDCTILKLLRVHAPGYEVVFTMVTLGSISKTELYEVTISNFLACTCRGF